MYVRFVDDSLNIDVVLLNFKILEKVIVVKLNFLRLNVLFCIVV